MRTIGNILWLILNGFWMAIAWAFIGVLLSITIILLQFGRQCFKLANFALWPFGRTAVPSPTAVTGGLIGNILWFIPGLILACPSRGDDAARMLRECVRLAREESRVVVFLEPTDLSEGMRLQIGTVQFMNRYEMTETEFMDKLKKVLSNDLKN